ncbi:hypothetical protein PPL_02406 [Heterostelium album PN500]|uniref:4'-phosphopantetheinyl transferase domain-containing protein n=1 Tax=Heterostelium pallidum (strain ATCC 26659 / Pp 5 / PN500) TaxID=670386 RepID=D3AZM4_HETP5|nr:hypothetical protein PPL_02406 [Heterostelium album PN500]EFA85403.1 hypothetical protein PPL_02406 [Heterostelium album PN500]|eukprot:XP_020437512.1 hypothetical protein PPL_02406 [Heterostelium album PN500]
MSNRCIKILGIGNDIVKISRFTVNSENERFLKRAFHPVEIEKFKELKLQSQQNALQYLAGRWAAKESVYKAFKGIERAKLNFQNIRILSNSDGSPYVDLIENSLDLSKQLNVTDIHISISHDTDYAIANKSISIS